MAKSIVKANNKKAMKPRGRAVGGGGRKIGKK